MKILPIDENRIILKQANISKITGRWKDAVDLIIESYKNMFKDKLVSVYINGSVATGNAIEKISDIDTNAIIDMSAEDIKHIKENILPNEIKKLNASLPFVSKVEMHIHTKDNWSDKKRFQMKITGICVYGKNYDNETPDYTLSRETFQKFRFSIPKDITKAKVDLEHTTNPVEIKRITTWIAKRLIRNAGTMAMWRGEFYTMDVSLMAEIFIKAYKEKKKEIETLLNWVTNPPEDKATVVMFLNTFGNWLIAEDIRVFKD